ncbi:MAG: undecaprenyl diphosphate synthase family protein, partial [Flavobacteriales bacterium]|nr:undecaprenyl diphosphate synthase family protein [Flavobacteriales bacterium]
MSTLQAVAVRATFANGFDPHSLMVDNNHSARSLPHHVAVIMDGNGRWARERGEDRVFGHAHGVESVRAMVRAARELG